MVYTQPSEVVLSTSAALADTSPQTRCLYHQSCTYLYLFVLIEILPPLSLNKLQTYVSPTSDNTEETLECNVMSYVTTNGAAPYGEYPASLSNLSGLPIQARPRDPASE